MSKSVLISIQPKWCELIASGKKTVEVRKSKPTLEVPFKCYIYCTKPKKILLDVVKSFCIDFNGEIHYGKTQFIKGEEGSVCDMWGKRQKVIGEFICDRFIPIAFENGVYSTTEKCGRAYMTVEEALKYGKGKPLFGWHISNLKIYDEPKELSEFKKIKRECWYAVLGIAKRDCPECKNKGCFVTRPPQSWCYVEDMEGAK